MLGRRRLSPEVASKLPKQHVKERRRTHMHIQLHRHVHTHISIDVKCQGDPALQGQRHQGNNQFILARGVPTAAKGYTSRNHWNSRQLTLWPNGAVLPQLRGKADNRMHKLANCIQTHELPRVESLTDLEFSKRAKLDGQKDSRIRLSLPPHAEISGDSAPSPSSHEHSTNSSSILRPECFTKSPALQHFTKGTVLQGFDVKMFWLTRALLFASLLAEAFLAVP
ncbi:hypothetical protein STEG23_026605, partial [Scotinomys teguina]